MPEQRWFAGVAVVDRRALDPAEWERLDELTRSLRLNALGTIALIVLCIAGFVAVSLVSFAVGWLGPILLGMTSGVVRLLPQRRFVGLRALLMLGKDSAARTVEVCRSEETTLEVLTHSHVLWTRDGRAVEPPIVAHASATAQVPVHALMAANFVRPAIEVENLLIHQRALTEEELRELDGYAAPVNVAMVVLAIVAACGAVLTFAYALTGRITTLFPPFAFLVIALLAARSVIRAWRGRRLIGPDLEAGFVVILRSSADGELGPAEEILPHSNFVWTIGGQVASRRLGPDLWLSVGVDSTPPQSTASR